MIAASAHPLGLIVGILIVVLAQVGLALVLWWHLKATSRPTEDADADLLLDTHRRPRGHD